VVTVDQSGVTEKDCYYTISIQATVPKPPENVTAKISGDKIVVDYT